MGDLFVSALVVIITAVIAAAIFIITGRKKKEKEAGILQLAQRNGWVYEKVNQAQLAGFILQTADWTLEALVTSSPQGSEAGSSPLAYKNKWFTDRVTSQDGQVMIGPRLPQLPPGEFGDMVLQKALRMMLGDEANQAVGLGEVKVGRSSFGERYSVWASSREAAEKVLTFDLENALLKWNDKELPLIKFSATGTQITTRQVRIETAEGVQALVVLGDAVLGG